MKNRNLLALAIFSTLLAACGGSSDDNNKAADPSANQPPLRGPEPGLQYEHLIGETDRDGSFGIINSNNPGNNRNNNGGNTNPGNNNPGNNNGGNKNSGGNNNGNGTSYNQISINGQTITLLPKNITQGAGGIYDGDDAGYTTHIGNNLKNALYGIVINNKTGQASSFYKESKALDNMVLPAAGLFIYRGLATHYDETQKQYSQGTSQFNVDFGARKLSGVISTTNGSGINLKADIVSGARFRGTSADGVTAEGRFFENEGKEMIGVYSKLSATPNINEFIGAFGASRQ